jgi:hypothetical protein
MTDKAIPITYGCAPSWSKKLTWKPMRKMKLQSSTNFPSQTGSFGWYPNESWIPFALLYTPDLDGYYQDEDGNTPDEAQILSTTHDCLWFTDS